MRRLLRRRSRCAGPFSAAAGAGNHRTDDYGVDFLRGAIFAPAPAVLRWIRIELSDVLHDEHVTETVPALCSRLSASTAEPVDAAIVDFDAMSASELAQLGRARRSGFDGDLVALGRVAAETEDRLSIRIVLRRPFGSEALRTAIESIAEARAERVTDVDW